MKKQLAILGHETRDKEVIEILQMLGGKKTIYSGKDTFHMYYLDNSRNIVSEFYDITSSLISLTYDVYTLEEFLKYFPFKINDMVTNSDYRGRGIIKEIVWDSDICEVKYHVNFFEDFGVNAWFKSDEIKLSNLRLMDKAESLHELYESKASSVIIDSEACKDEVEIVLNDYEIEIRDGKTFAVKKKPKYPTTYEECCGVLGMTYDYPDIRMVSTDEFSLYSNFIPLIRCRDAYWKIAGEEMGLGKSWEPDYNNKTEKYVVYPYQYLYSIDKEYYRNTILSFPTKEMRDAFYENFKDLIEKCKELL